MANTAPIERASCVAVELVAHEATVGAREGEGRPVLTTWDCRDLCVLKVHSRDVQQPDWYVPNT
jgi:hypothetical protein